MSSCRRKRGEVTTRRFVSLKIRRFRTLSGGSSTTMAEQPQQQRESDSSPPQLKLPSFVVNLFPFLQPKSPSPANGADGAPKPAGGVSKDKETQNSTVSFPYNPPKSTEPLKLEAEPSSGSTSNSLVIWQVF